MGNVVFSVIVPVYNVEKYIKECVDSILLQTFKDYELILVNDGTTDKSGQICDDYAKKDKRVRVIHKVNGGLSSARNVGLDAAIGKYIVFIDSDDYWDDKDALKNIYNRLSKTGADMLIFPLKRFFEDNKKFSNTVNSSLFDHKIICGDKNAAVKYMIEHNLYRASACNKVVNRSVIKENGMRFIEGVLSEDMDWCGDLLIYCNRFDAYEVPFYCYRQQRSGSITQEKGEKLVNDKLYMIEKGSRQAEDLNTEERLYLKSYYAYEYSVALGVSGEVKNKELLAKLHKLKEILNYDISNKVKKVNRLMKMVGYSLTRRMLIIFVKVKR